MLDRSKYKERKYRKLRRDMLSAWYGEEIARTEIVACSPRPRPIHEVMDELGAQVFQPETLQRIELERAWEKIAGRQLAALTRVGGFRDGILNVEVRHSAFLRELAETADLLRSRVNAAIGGGCRTIRFIPSSGTSRH